MPQQNATLSLATLTSGDASLHANEQEIVVSDPPQTHIPMKKASKVSFESPSPKRNFVPRDADDLKACPLSTISFHTSQLNGVVSTFIGSPKRNNGQTTLLHFWRWLAPFNLFRHRYITTERNSLKTNPNDQKPSNSGYSRRKRNLSP